MNSLERMYERQLAEINAKLQRLDEAIRGNGKISIQARLDRLEQIQSRRRKTHWIIVGACASAGVSAILQAVQLLVQG